MTEAAPPRLLTISEARALLGVGKTKFYELINDGEIATVDVSRNSARHPRRVGESGPRPSRRVEAAEIQRYIERNRVVAR